ncbi:hypothetical protein F5Y03DRAFT_400575 [Xylaria venustula]|nr:hypothetical protein F5Y03DRAFT_400575 [Xylaria venustula]
MIAFASVLVSFPFLAPVTEKIGAPDWYRPGNGIGERAFVGVLEALGMRNGGHGDWGVSDWGSGEDNPDHPVSRTRIRASGDWRLQKLKQGNRAYTSSRNSNCNGCQKPQYRGYMNACCRTKGLNFASCKAGHQ